MNLEKLPIGIQAFETMRNSGYLYVDKTQYIHRLATQGMFYFLSRPRRFGKSLLASTLKCLFEGKKDLFDGLWIAEHGQWEWQQHPAILLDFNGIPASTTEELKRSLTVALETLAEDAEIVLKAEIPELQFKELIRKLYKEMKMPVAVLIDEYDKPLIDHLGKGETARSIAKANRDVLKSFFGILKDATIAPFLRFVFLTGVSRFSRVSIFSELNNLQDISMHAQYADMLGYTQEELETRFQPYIEQVADSLSWTVEQVLTTLVTQYNGYRFSERDSKVYNPFSVLNAFSEHAFKNYWFSTGTPTFLINLLKQERYNLAKVEEIKVSTSIFTTFDIDRLNPEALLFQTGYVTIKAVHDGIYTLGYPNQEVKTSFAESLLFAAPEGIPHGESSDVLRLAQYLRDEDFDAFFKTMTAIFASIPYTLEVQRDEAYFHTIFYLLITASGAETRCEDLTDKGRIDLTVVFPDKVYLIEFKCNQSPEAAIKQIQTQGYAEKYRQPGRKIWLIGVNFSTERHNLDAWKMVPNGNS